MSDFDANKDTHWWDRYFVSIMVCNLEVPMCCLQCGKASKSPQEIIVFLRFLEHLNNLWDPSLYVLTYVFRVTGRMVK